MSFPLLLLSLFLGQAHLRGLDQMRHLAPIYVVFGLGVVIVMFVRMWKAGERLDRLKTGFDAELAVGQQLDQLMRQGAHVFHDIPADQFNIDHVVVSSSGVFAVETKGVTKRTRGGGRAGATVSFDGRVLKFPTWTTAKPIEQAERQAAWLAQWLSSAAGRSVRVLPIVALPGWFVDRTGRGTVRVFNGKELAGLLESRGTQPLSASEMRQFAHQIDQRCRTVAPRYAESTRVT